MGAGAMSVPVWLLPVAFLAGPGCMVALGYCITRKLVTGRWWGR